jgi:hypothetical protein
VSKKDKPPRTVAFTARELIVELSKCEPGARVYFEHAHEDGYKPLMFSIDTINPKSPFCGGIAVVLTTNTAAVQK